MMFLTSLPFFGQIKILPLGESTTAQTPSYRQKLCQLLTADGRNYDMIGPVSDGAGVPYDGDHAGFSGNTCDQLSAWVTANKTIYVPDVVLLWEGTNDCGWSFKSQYQPGQTTTGKLSSLIDNISNSYPNALIFVGAIMPMSFTAYAYYPTPNGVAASNVVAYNDSMPSMIARKVAENRKVYFVDSRGMEMNTDVGSDGIHGTPTGYQKMGVFFYNAIKSIFSVESITLPSTFSVSLSTARFIPLTCLPANAIQNVNWTSSNTDITVNLNGQVISTATGTAIITATSKIDATKSASCTVTVYPAISKVALPVAATVEVGATLSITPTFIPLNVEPTVIWSAADTTILSINPSSGLMKGKKQGSTLIKATSLTSPSKLGKSTITVSAASALNELHTNEISIFPNPIVNRVFEIKSNDFSQKDYTVTIYDTMGKQLFTKSLSALNTNQVTLPSYISNGIYLLKCSNEKHLFSTKIVVRN
jgi:lysophospholipase L1-like esterase